jgi:putative flippase GtrA
MLNQIYVRYVGASAASLGIDFAIFMLAMSLGIPPAPAAAAGYCCGIVCHWLLSSQLVFVGRVAATGRERRQQQGLFVASALVGLALTTAIVGLGSHYGLDPRLAKAVAILVSFQTTYLLRKKVVFA